MLIEMCCDRMKDLFTGGYAYLDGTPSVYVLLKGTESNYEMKKLWLGCCPYCGEPIKIEGED